MVGMKLNCCVLIYGNDALVEGENIIATSEAFGWTIVSAGQVAHSP